MRWWVVVLKVGMLVDAVTVDAHDEREAIVAAKLAWQEDYPPDPNVITVFQCGTSMPLRTR